MNRWKEFEASGASPHMSFPKLLANPVPFALLLLPGSGGTSPFPVILPLRQGAFPAR